MGLRGQGPTEPDEAPQGEETLTAAQNNIKGRNNNTLDNKKLNIIYTNIDSITNKFSELQNVLNTLANPPHIIAITEINSKHCRYPLQESELHLDGYTLYASNVGTNHLRGIAVYIANIINVTQVELSTSFNENITLSFFGVDKQFTLSVVYRSPNSATTNDLQLLQHITEITKTSNGDKLFIGDFNFPNINWDTWSAPDGDTGSERFLDCLRKNFLFQNINSPTRVRGTQTPHILDLVLTNEAFVQDVHYLAPVGFSDHCMIHLVCKWESPHHLNNGHKLNYTKGDYTGLRNFITDRLKTKDPNIFVEAEQASTVLNSIIIEGTNKYIPVSKGNAWKQKSNWSCPIDDQTKLLIKRKRRLWTRYIKTRDPSTYNSYKVIRNSIKQVIRKQDKAHQRAVAAECKLNPKKFWGYVKSKTNTSNAMGNIKVYNSTGVAEVIVDDEKKSNAFADYFSTVFSHEPNTEFDKLPNIKCNYPMSDLNISHSTVLEKLTILRIDKSPGPDNIHPRVLKELQDQLSIPIAKLYDVSLQTGKLPEEWRHSTITAIHKKGSKSTVTNYRPIALTSIICKTMESIIRDHIMDHFTKNNLFSNKQFGFIKGRSTVLQLLNVLDAWTASLDNGGNIDAIYTDFEKAFDKVPHIRLLSKLKAYGITDEIVAWIQDFLCNRNQRVRVNGKFSAWHKVLSGIPQGSVLGPLLFIIYINDLVELCEKNANIFLFADDAKLFKHITCQADQVALQESCNALSNWSNQWLLPLNITKCILLRIGKSNNYPNTNDYYLTLRNITSKLSVVTSVKDLGVIIDDRLNFNEHIHTKINKAYSILGIIKRNFKHMDSYTFTKLYKTMVRSHLEYAESVWAPNGKGKIDDLEKVQKRATKMIRHCQKMPYRDRLEHLKLPTLTYRRIRGDMVEVFKILTNKYDKNVTPHLGLSNCTYTRGNTLKLATVRPNLDIRKYSFSVRIVSIWNTLPDSVIASDTINKFKNALDKHWQNEDILYNYKAKLSRTGVRGLDI